MANKFYVSGEQRAGKVEDLFATIAPRYDLINDLQSFGLHRRWKRRLLNLAGFRRGEVALDLCCGTGDVAFEFAQTGGRVVGIDFSGPMLKVAATRRVSVAPKIQQQNGRLHFVRGDTMQIPFADEVFDVVTIAYGMRNLRDYWGGLMEMSRVLKPGGRALALDFGKPKNALWRGIYLAYLRWFVPVFGRVYCRDAQTYGYILESLKYYPGQRGVAAAMAELGYEQVRIVDILGGAMAINMGWKAVG